MIELYTDGSLRQSHQGGWAFYYRLSEKDISGSGYQYTFSSNRMEMVAAVKGLQSLLANGMENKRICVLSDSQALVVGARDHLPQWVENGWINSRGETVFNKDLWEQIQFYSQCFKTRWLWIKGHNREHGNALVNRLAQGASKTLVRLSRSEVLAPLPPSG